jgi:hypothetical protein
MSNSAASPLELYGGALAAWAVDENNYFPILELGLMHLILMPCTLHLISLSRPFFGSMQINCDDPAVLQTLLSLYLEQCNAPSTFRPSGDAC